MNIFKNFSDVYSSVNEKILSGPDSIDINEAMNKLSSSELQSPFFQENVNKQIVNFYQYKMKALREIEDYIMSFQWLSNSSLKTIERVRYFITHECSYKKTQEKFVMELSAVQVCIFRSSKLLEEKIGDNTLELIDKAKTKEQVDLAMNIFNTNVNFAKTSKVLVKEVAQLMPKAKYCNGIKPLDCLPEAKLLMLYSSGYIKQVINSLNMDKLSFLLYIIDSDDVSFKKERLLFRDYLQCKIKRDELKQELSNLEANKPFAKLSNEEGR